MSIHISPHISRGSIVKGFLPHFGQEELWGRNLLVHGFVFAANADRPYALAVSRFSYNSLSSEPHDVLFPVADHRVVYPLNEKGLSLRTDRIDFVPLVESYFSTHLRQKGNVGSPVFWDVVLPQLELTHADGNAATLFDRLQPGDRVLEYSEPDSRRAYLPASILPVSAVSYDPYVLALQEKHKQEREEAKNLHQAFLSARRAPAPVPVPLPPVSSAPAELPALPECTSSEPWWKTDPVLLENIKEQARLREEKKKPACAPISPLPEMEPVDWSEISTLFNGIEIGARKERMARAPQPTPAKKKKSISPFEEARRREQIDQLVPLFQEALGNCLFRVRPTAENGVFLRHEPLRGTILRINPMKSEFPHDKYGAGIVWNVFKDEEGAVAGAELIPIRRDTEGFKETITVCNPFSPAQMSGFVLLPDHLYRIEMTTDFLTESQPQEKPINPCFVRDVANYQAKNAALSPHIFGLPERPQNWVEVPQNAILPNQGEAMEYYNLLQLERDRQASLQLPAPAALAL